MKKTDLCSLKPTSLEKKLKEVGGIRIGDFKVFEGVPLPSLRYAALSKQQGETVEKALEDLKGQIREGKLDLGDAEYDFLITKSENFKSLHRLLASLLILLKEEGKIIKIIEKNNYCLAGEFLYELSLGESYKNVQDDFKGGFYEKINVLIISLEQEKTIRVVFKGSYECPCRDYLAQKVVGDEIVENILFFSYNCGGGGREIGEF